MKITARQLQSEDTLPGGHWGVVTSMLSADRSSVALELITAGGGRTTVTYPANKILVVDRATVDGTDPLSRPYWWGLEREQERKEDAAVYTHDEMIDSYSAWAMDAGAPF